MARSSVKRKSSGADKNESKKRHKCKFRAKLWRIKKVIDDDDTESESEVEEKVVYTEDVYTDNEDGDYYEGCEDEEPEEEEIIKVYQSEDDYEEEEYESEPEEEYIRIQDTIQRKLGMKFDANQCRRVGEIAAYLHFHRYGRYPLKHETGVARRIGTVNVYYKKDEDLIVSAAQAYRLK